MHQQVYQFQSKVIQLQSEVEEQDLILLTMVQIQFSQVLHQQVVEKEELVNKVEVQEALAVVVEN